MENYKKLTRLYIPEPGFRSGQRCALPEDQVHYLRNVMRKEKGDRLRIFNGHDGEWLATLEELGKKKAVLALDHQLLEQKNGSDVWVLASPVKKEAFDLMVEKACELGAAKFIPVICEHTVVHKINKDRLQAIAVEAAEQSERLDVMIVEPLTNLEDCLKSNNYNKNLIFCIERGQVPPIAEVIKKLAGSPKAVLIGPEGGFSSRDIDFIHSFANIHDASLGERILKTETALIAALSCVQLLP